jgi:hypothetical protein
VWPALPCLDTIADVAFVSVLAREMASADTRTPKGDRPGEAVAKLRAGAMMNTLSAFDDHQERYRAL